MISTSQSLIHRLRDPSDAEAWDRFVHLYTPMLLNWAKRAGLSDADTSDVMQDVFTRLLSALPKFTYDPSRSFRSYLSTILNNCWIDHTRQRRSQMPASTGHHAADFPETAPEIGEDEYRHALLQRSLTLVRHEFSVKIWQGFQLTVIEAKTPADAARILETSVNAIYLGRARVLRRLREVLRDLLD
jgi:RNA polymerase sigma-70 factor (ECF subfamily)